MKNSTTRRVFAIAFLSVFIGVSAQAFDWGKSKRKKEKQEAKCCNKAMEKECAREMKQASKRAAKTNGEKETR